jgi:hypothetical protein
LSRWAITVLQAASITPEPTNSFWLRKWEIKSLPADGEPKLAVFNTGGMLWSSEGFIYDEADQVALPPEQQSIKWKTRAEEVAELSCGPYEAIALCGHFYYGGFSV